MPYISECTVHVLSMYCTVAMYVHRGAAIHSQRTHIPTFPGAYHLCIIAHRKSEFSDNAGFSGNVEGNRDLPGCWIVNPESS